MPFTKHDFIPEPLKLKQTGFFHSFQSDTNIYTEESIIDHILDEEYMFCYLEFQLRHKQYARRTYKEKNDLYQIKHLIEISAPYKDLQTVEEQFGPIFKLNFGQSEKFVLENLMSIGNFTYVIISNKEI